MWTFRAMGTEVTVAAPCLSDGDEAVAATAIAGLFAATEARFSRFRPESELTRLNRGVGPFRVSAEMLDVLDAARDHVAATGGLFDPAIGGALVAAGYDRSFAPGELDRDAAHEPPRRARFDELVIDRSRHTVTRPAHLQLDLGGFLKGRTVDRAAAMLPACAMVDAGGDVVLRGDGPDGAGWEVEVEDPADASRVILTLRVRERAVATSAANRRNWRVGSARAHHLFDPRTGCWADAGVRQATVLAPTAEEADVLAKLVFILGPSKGAIALRERGRAGVIVDRDGEIDIVGDAHVEKIHA